MHYDCFNSDLVYCVSISVNRYGISDVSTLDCNPILSLLGGWIYGKACDFDWLTLWLVAFLFIPVIYFHMDGQWDCMIYPGIYVVLMSVGMVVGKIFQKKKVV